MKPSRNQRVFWVGLGAAVLIYLGVYLFYRQTQSVDLGSRLALAPGVTSFRVIGFSSLTASEPTPLGTFLAVIYHPLMWADGELSGGEVAGF